MSHLADLIEFVRVFGLVALIELMTFHPICINHSQEQALFTISYLV